MRIDQVKTGAVLVVKPMDKRIDASSATAFKAKIADLIQGEKSGSSSIYRRWILSTAPAWGPLFPR